MRSFASILAHMKWLCVCVDCGYTGTTIMTSAVCQSTMAEAPPRPNTTTTTTTTISSYSANTFMTNWRMEKSHVVCISRSSHKIDRNMESVARLQPQASHSYAYKYSDRIFRWARREHRFVAEKSFSVSLFTCSMGSANGEMESLLYSSRSCSMDLLCCHTFNAQRFVYRIQSDLRWSIMNIMMQNAILYICEFR